MNYLEQLPIKVITAHRKGEPVEVLVDGDYDGEWLGQFEWQVSPTGYVYRGSLVSDDLPEKTVIYLHRVVAQPPEGMWVRHLNGNRLDNRSANLEWMTPKELIKRFRTPARPAQHKRKNVSPLVGTEYRGVQRSYRKYKGQAHMLYPSYTVKIRGKTIASFPTAEIAAKMYDREARRIYGDKAILNFPKEGEHGRD